MSEETKIEDKLIKDAEIRYARVRESCPFCQLGLTRLEKDRFTCSKCKHYFDKATLQQFKSLIEKTHREGYNLRRMEVYNSKSISIHLTEKEEQDYASVFESLNNTKWMRCVIPYFFGIFKHNEQVHDFQVSGLRVRKNNTRRLFFEIEGIEFVCRKCKIDLLVNHWAENWFEKLGGVIRIGNRIEKLYIKDYNEF